MTNTPGPRHPGEGAIPMPPHRQDALRMLLLGDFGAIRSTIRSLYACGFCEVTHWSNPIPTGRGGEYIAIYTRRSAPEDT